VSISRHATYDVLGATVPLVITVATVPLYLALQGAERFGIINMPDVIRNRLGVRAQWLPRARSSWRTR